MQYLYDYDDGILDPEECDYDPPAGTKECVTCGAWFIPKLSEQSECRGCIALERAGKAHAFRQH